MLQAQVGHYHHGLELTVQLLPGVAIVSLLTALQVNCASSLKFGRGPIYPHSLALTNSSVHSSDRSFVALYLCSQSLTA